MVEEKEDRFTLFKQGDERIFRQYYEKYYHALSFRKLLLFCGTAG